MAVILTFFGLHWVLSVFMQTFFLHRYSAHRMFTMSPRAEKVFHFLTFLFQGSSYLNPRGYAILHREHHAFSDTDKDPHSPHTS
ncbi:MAG TPA: acyl-CoA desaturase, partial [Polyangiaceae bacterium]|nr:acyl-CoA desaturase [Polyangiaceae bacterium]